MNNNFILKDLTQHWEEIKDFVFEHADMVRFTRSPWTEIGFVFIKKHGTDNDPMFQKLLKRYEHSLIKRETTHERFNHVKQWGSAHFEHYYYALSDDIKESLTKARLIVQNHDSNFYGFEDANFYHEGSLVCSVISHENIAILNLTKNEDSKLGQCDLRPQ